MLGAHTHLQQSALTMRYISHVAIAVIVCISRLISFQSRHLFLFFFSHINLILRICLELRNHNKNKYRRVQGAVYHSGHMKVHRAGTPLWKTFRCSEGSEDQWSERGYYGSTISWMRSIHFIFVFCLGAVTCKSYMSDWKSKLKDKWEENQAIRYISLQKNKKIFKRIPIQVFSVLL